MASYQSADHLRRFQDLGTKEALLVYVQTLGQETAEYEKAMDAIEPVLRPLSFGMRPAQELLDREALQRWPDAVRDILSWLADSQKADRKTAAVELMGALGWESFIPRLEQLLSSAVPWERMASVQALAQMGTSRAIRLLRGAVMDPDPAIRNAVHRALETQMESSS